MMRKRAFIVAGSVVVGGWLLAPAGHAQTRAGRPAAPGGARPVASRSAVAAEPDLLRPYGARDEREFSADSSGRGYSRPSPRALTEAAPRGASHPRGVSSYFPEMRTGQGPNRNVIDPRSLCVPGRRALLPR